MDVPGKTRELANYMARQLRLRGGALGEVAERAGRLIPRHLRRDIATLVEAETMAENPKMARLIDRRRVARAEKRVRRFLDRQSPGAARRAEILDRLAVVVFVIFAVILALFFWLLTQGYFR